MQHGKPRRMVDRHQLGAREGQTGFGGVADGSVVPRKPGNAGGGKGPWFKATQEVARARRMGQPLNSGKRQALQVASQALRLCLVREPDAGNPPVRFDERDVETELRRGYSGTARRKGRQQTNRTYCHRATSRLYRRNRTFEARSQQKATPCRLPGMSRPLTLR